MQRFVVHPLLLLLSLLLPMALAAQEGGGISSTEPSEDSSLRGPEVETEGGEPEGAGESEAPGEPGNTASPEHLTSQVVQDIVENFRPHIRSCLFDSRSDLSGQIQIMVAFNIRPTGLVENVRIHESNTEVAKIDACVETVMRALVFPAHPGPTAVIHFPFMFVTE